MKIKPASADLVKSILLSSVVPLQAIDIIHMAAKQHDTLISPREIRLAVNWLRTQDELPFLLSGNSGYYISSDEALIRKFEHRIKSQAIEQFRICKAIRKQLFEKLNSPIKFT